jgi:hypothetical protein
MRGKWLGSWKMSKGAEKMLHRMIQPNADLRCTAPEVLQDPYWDASLPAPGHKKPASSGTPDKSKSYNDVPPPSSRRGSRTQQPERERTKKYDDKENSPTVPNPKKAPARQRVLSGTDGLLLRFLSIVDVNNARLFFSPRLNEEAAQRQCTPAHPTASTREYVCTQTEIPKGPRQGECRCPAEARPTQETLCTWSSSQAFRSRRSHDADTQR